MKQLSKGPYLYPNPRKRVRLPQDGPTPVRANVNAEVSRRMEEEFGFSPLPQDSGAYSVCGATEPSRGFQDS